MNGVAAAIWQWRMEAVVRVWLGELRERALQRATRGQAREVHWMVRMDVQKKIDHRCNAEEAAAVSSGSSSGGSKRQHNKSSAACHDRQSRRLENCDKDSRSGLQHTARQKKASLTLFNLIVFSGSQKASPASGSKLSLHALTFNQNSERIRNLHKTTIVSGAAAAAAAAARAAEVQVLARKEAGESRGAQETTVIS